MSGGGAFSTDRLRDKIKGGWAGQTIGVTFGGPTEFRYRGTMIGDDTPIAWNDTLLKEAYEQSPGLYDDIYMDFTFVDDTRDKWGLGFQITTGHVAGKRASGSLSWGGINNTYFWIDPSSGVAGVIMMQLLPFADTKSLAVYDAFERGVYRLTPAR